ncbi:MAG: DUF2760 domain-containing protein [Desulfobacterales bacterium]|nr:DUF2760 domain-containing protein [Desulfobacterales bacterium]
MNLINSFSYRCLLWLLVINLVFLGIFDAAVYFGAAHVFSGDTFSELMGAALQNPELGAWAREMMPVFARIKALFFPLTAAVFILMALVQWAVLRASFRRVMRKSGANTKSAEKKETRDEQKEHEPKKPSVSKKEIQEQNHRYYLHLLSVLQRQGRLVDFLKEDLSAYGDAQIGAAVRSIHENCSETIEKHFAPRGIIDKEEGQQVTVAADFDPSSIKLTGNVTGEPPFTGILRHRGWRAGRLELPVLSGRSDPRIIAPAEVEVS